MTPPLDSPSPGAPALSLAVNEEELRTTLEELRAAEEELRLQNEALLAANEMALVERQRYRELFDAAPDGYLMTDPAGKILEANLAASALFGRQSRWLAGKPLRVFVHPDDRSRFDHLLDELHAGRPVAGAELRVGPTGSPDVTVAVHANAASGPGLGRAFRWLFHDLTAIKQARDQLVRAERLAAVGQTVAVIAHESRAGLQRAVACLRLLRAETAPGTSARDYADRAGRALDDLGRLFDDVRALAKLPVLQPGPCDLAAVWRKAWDEVGGDRPTALDELPPECDLICVADGFRLGQVFRNLFENAVAAGAGRVTVTATAADLDGRPAVRVSVHDDGPGIAPEYRDQLFEPFFTTRPDGTGLGLAVVRSLVEAHGGTAAFADPPAGTTIVITLPRELP